MKQLIITLTLLLFGYSAYCQDKIVYKSGKIDSVKIVEISENDITYKDFANQDGPSFRISKDSIEKIILENGQEIVVFKKKDVPYPSHLTAKGTNLYDNDKRLTKDYLSQILDDDLYSSLKAGRRFEGFGVGMVLGGAALAGFGTYGAIWCISNASVASKSDISIASSFLGVGIPLLVTGFIFTSIGKKKVASVADNYNLTFGSTNSGVGLALTF